MGVLALSNCAADQEAADGASSAKETKVACIELDKATIDGIADGLTKKATVKRGFAVKRPTDEVEMNLRYIAALEIKDASGTSTAMLAMGEPEEGGGPFIAADNYAQLYFDWGSAAKDGSPIKDAADKAWLSDAGKDAKKCL